MEYGLLILVAGFAVGVAAQAWKGHTGALWGFLTVVVLVGWSFVLTFVDIHQSVTRGHSALSATGETAKLVWFVMGILGPSIVMMLLVASLPKRN